MKNVHILVVKKFRDILRIGEDPEALTVVFSGDRVPNLRDRNCWYIFNTESRYAYEIDKLELGQTDGISELTLKLGNRWKVSKKEDLNFTSEWAFFKAKALGLAELTPGSLVNLPN